MKRISLLVAAALLAIPLPSPGNPAETNPPAIVGKLDFGSPDNWHEYEGDIDGKLRIGMTLHVDAGAKGGAGCYYYVKYCKDIETRAVIDGRKISIEEFDPKGAMTGRFTGEFARSDPRHHFSDSAELGIEVIAGTWSKPDGSASKPFYLAESHSGAVASQKARYANAGFDDAAEADAFMAKFRQALLDHKPVAAAAMIQCPITVKIDGKRTKIATAGELVKRYDSIFSPAYLDRVKNAAPCHMFSRDQGVMLGNGEVWIAPVVTDERDPKKDVTRVIAINN